MVVTIIETRPIVVMVPVVETRAVSTEMRFLVVLTAKMRLLVVFATMAATPSGFGLGRGEAANPKHRTGHQGQREQQREMSMVCLHG
ncbi:MAG: hypothetical protein AB7U59_10915 [Desulfovibrionaceae bacterium]